MIPKEIIQAIRRIEIRTSKVVNDIFCGEYHSVFKGRGMEFVEAREYQPGDDVRSIDWNVTARLGHPYVKEFVEEREMTVMLVVDASASNKFGTTGKSKMEIAAEICAVLAFSAIKNNDRVGLLIFADGVKKFLPPQKGRQHVLRVIREVLFYEPEGRETNIPAAMEFLGRVLRRRGVIFLVSDFLAQDYENALRITSKKHDLVTLSVADPREQVLPNVGRILLEDAECGVRRLVDTRKRSVRERFMEMGIERRTERNRRFYGMNIDSVEFTFPEKVDSKGDPFYIKPLMAFFKKRAKRLR